MKTGSDIRVVCPKCGYASENHEACDSCGVVFSRVRDKEITAVLPAIILPPPTRRRKLRRTPLVRYRATIGLLVILTVFAVALEFADHYILVPPVRSDIAASYLILVSETRLATGLLGDEKNAALARLRKRSERLEKRAAAIQPSRSPSAAALEEALRDGASSLSATLRTWSDEDTSMPSTAGVEATLESFEDTFAYARYGNMSSLGIQVPGAVQLTSRNFESEVLRSRESYWVTFWSESCEPCNAMLESVSGISEREHLGFHVGEINADNEPELANRFQVRSLPVSLLFRDGEIRERIEGFRKPSEIRQLARRHLQRI